MPYNQVTMINPEIAEYIRVQYPSDEFPEAYRDYVQGNMFCLNQEDIQGRNVLDIGGYVGYVALTFAGYGAKRIVCVEANESNFVRMKKITDKYHQIIPLHFAAHNGIVKTVSLVDTKGITKVVEGKGTSTIEARSLHQLLSFFDPDDNDMVLKIDIEGGEYDVLLHASGEDIRRFKVIFLETHQVPHLEKLPARKAIFLRDYLTFMGYEIAATQQCCTWYKDPEGKVTACVPMDDAIALKLIRKD